MTDNVVSLAGAGKPEKPFNPNQQDVVEAAERLLEEARSGEIHVLCYVTVDGHGRAANNRAGFLHYNHDCFALLGGLSQLSYAMQQQITEIMEGDNG